MKCIRTVDGIVKRVKDPVAEQLVKNDNAEYVPKNVWKKERKKSS